MHENIYLELYGLQKYVYIRFECQVILFDRNKILLSME